MIFDPAEYTSHKGTTEDITYRKATEEETARLRRLENIRSKMTGPVSLIIIGFSVALLIYFSTSKEFSDIFMYAAGLFVILAVMNSIRAFVSTRKSNSYEIAEGIMVGYMEVNNRPYMSVWCEKDEVYIPKLRYLSTFHREQGMPLLIVRGDRGEGKKPNYFVVTAANDPII